jgi:capsule polysaccharide export protein KpsC/LpsZ
VDTAISQSNILILNMKNRSVKKSLLSLPLTYMGFAGYLNPFTNEAQVNDKIPMYNFPTTTST